ncbi:MAG: tellurite resistance TerB family protein [Acetobacteraceae bacterium]
MRHQGNPWSLLRGLTSTAAVVALADGTVHPAERLGLGHYLRQARIPGLQKASTHALFDTCLRELEQGPAGGRPGLADVLGGFRDTPWAWVVLRAAEHVAGADGAVHPSEARVIETIRAILHLPRGVPERYPACVMRRAQA